MAAQSSVTLDPGAEIARIATQEVRANRIGVEALTRIAMLTRSSPLAAEMAKNALRRIKDVMVHGESDELLRFPAGVDIPRALEHYTGVLEEAERDA